MGFLEDVKPSSRPASSKPIQGGFLETVQPSPNALGGFIQKRLEYESRKGQATAEETRKFHPVKSFKEGMAEYTGAERSFRGAFLEGKPVQEGGKLYSDTLTDFTKRIEKALATPNEDWADVVSEGGSIALGALNVALAPIAGIAKGAETIPVLGAVATGLNNVVAGIFSGAGNAATSALYKLPLISDESKQKLEPVVAEAAGLGATIFLFSKAGKAKGKIVESALVKPKIEALNARLKEIGEALSKDPNLQTRAAQFVAEHGPVRNLPVESQTPDVRSVVEPKRPVEEVPTTPKVEEQVPPRLASDEYNQLLIELDYAEAGKRKAYVYTDESGSIEKITSKRSTFPDWLPEEVRLKKLIDQYMKDRDGSVNDASIKYKEGSRLDILDKAVRAEEARRMAKNEPPIQESTVGGKPVTEETIPEATDIAPGLQQPVSSTGQPRTPALAQRTAGDLARELGQYFGDINLPNYNKSNNAVQAERVFDLIARDPELALDIAMGRKVSPDVLSTAVWLELYKRAERSGNVDMMFDLGRSGLGRAGVPEFAVRAGQEIQYLSNLEKGSTIDIVSRVEQRLAEQFSERKGKDTEKSVAKEESQLRQVVRENLPKTNDWLDFLNKYKC